MYVNDAEFGIFACKAYKINTKALRILVILLTLFLSVFRPL